MPPILTSEQMRDADARAISEYGIPSLVLMENAARGVCDCIAQHVDDLDGCRILVLCGGGNNGGDGLALARLASLAGALPTCCLLADPSKLSDDASSQLNMLRWFDQVRIVTWEQLQAENEHYDVVVDAMLGTGATGPLRGTIADAVDFTAELDGLRVAIDIPTGVEADTGDVHASAFEADITVTMAALKRGLVIGAGSRYSGEVYVAHIGAPSALYEDSTLRLLDDADALPGLRAAGPGSNKYDNGKVLVVAGSEGMTGAGVMTSTAALHTGCGLAVYAMPRGAAPTMAQRLMPEVMTRLLDSDDSGRFSAEAASELVAQLDGYHAIACGPGMSRSDGVSRVVFELLNNANAPVVLDADGLFPYSGQIARLRNRTCELVITPHHGEMARLLDTSSESVGNDPVATARRAAELIDGVVVLKGAPTVVAFADGRCWINSTGNPGMATGGTGDVLTGIIAAMIARNRSVEQSVLAAVYLHSLAGDIAVAERTMRALVATDIIEALPMAFEQMGVD